MSSEKDPFLELLEDYQHVFSDEAGERVLMDILNETNFLSPMVPPNTKSATIDPNTVTFHEGQRTIGLFILNRLGLTAQAVFDLTRETEND